MRRPRHPGTPRLQAHESLQWPPREGFNLIREFRRLATIHWRGEGRLGGPRIGDVAWSARVARHDLVLPAGFEPARPTFGGSAPSTGESVRPRGIEPRATRLEGAGRSIPSALTY